MTSEITFEVQDGALIIGVPGTSKRVIRPDGMIVIEADPVGDGTGAFVLLEPPKATGRTSNLVRVDSDGLVIWRAQLPEGEPTDSFVEFGESSGDVLASTWSGRHLVIDAASGQVLRDRFTK
ncbi:hypothetical protein [Leifsonia sp. LS-T14]|uniref:hypothetical protein n=1 Tax=unclassified Leifsonia TaxID=2663824 RepID=UPI0035A66CD8